MSDLISRQDLIDWLTSRIKVLEEVYGDLGGALSGVRKMVKAMPSAEEEEVFEWCHDCKEYDKEKHCCHRWTKVIRRTVEEMRSQQPEQRWIPVIEALPKMKEVVLITNDKGHVAYGQYQGTFRNNNEWFWRHKTLETVYAWMPLPEPAKIGDGK